MNNEEAVRRIETKLRIGKLDSLLLFLSSFLGLGLGLLQLVCGGIGVFVFFLPLLFLISVVPIYIGYIRGSILLDSIVERIRGWFYLMLAGGYYIGCAVILSIVDYYGLFEGSDRLSSVVALITVITVFSISAVTLFVFRYSQSTVKLFFKIFGYKRWEECEEINRVILFTLTSAASLGLAFLFIAFFLPTPSEIIDNCITEKDIIQKIGNIIANLVIFGVSIALVLSSISNERSARYWSKKAEETLKLEIKSG